MHVVILGNGITGITCARHIRKKSDHRITVISAETDYFYSRTALMYIYMGHMKYEHTKPYEDSFWKKNRIDLVRAWIEKIDTGSKKLIAADGREYPYDKLVLATGSASNKFGWPGQDLPGVQGLYSYQDLEALQANTQGPVSTAASLEFGFSQPSYVICESVHSDVPWRSDIVEEGYQVDPKTRTVTPNTRPGLGIQIRESEVKKHPFEQELPQRVWYQDGSVGDW